MSILISNEANKLFELALGERWMEAGLLARSTAELANIETLAADHAAHVLNNLASLGRVLGADDPSKEEITEIGWSIKALAEYGSVCLNMSDVARGMQDPAVRQVDEMLVANRG